MISVINKDNLNYFPATIATYGQNPNMPPTFFISPAKDYIYMYFTNTRCNEQRYVLNPAGMYLMFGYQVELENATIYAVDAFQAYSQSGKSMIYDFNTCYSPANPYNIEINQTYTYSNLGCTSPEGSLCVVVPGYTAGYVKIHVVPYVPKIAAEGTNELNVYPNPATNVLNITASGEMSEIVIYATTGEKILSEQTQMQSIDISSLPYGMYQIVCIFKDGSSIVKSFIKS